MTDNRTTTETATSATARQLSRLRLATSTRAPRSANASTSSRPRPRLPPVTTATRPVRSNGVPCRSTAAVSSPAACPVPGKSL